MIIISPSPLGRRNLNEVALPWDPAVDAERSGVHLTQGIHDNDPSQILWHILGVFGELPSHFHVRTDQDLFYTDHVDYSVHNHLVLAANLLQRRCGAPGHYNSVATRVIRLVAERALNDWRHHLVGTLFRKEPLKLLRVLFLEKYMKIIQENY